MMTKFDENMIISFMEKNYPVSRIKVNQRFKRGIQLDNGLIFLLSEKENYQAFKETLIKNLSDIFYIPSPSIKPLVEKFLNQ